MRIREGQPFTSWVQFIREAAPHTAATTSQEAEGKEWWLENLERELGLWGPI